MKKLITICSLAIALVASAQTNPTPNSLFSDWVQGIGASSNWTATPYGSYSTESEEWGAGLLALYTPPATEWVGVGLGLDYFAGHLTVVSGNVELKKSFNVAGVKVTPFLAAGLGLGLDTPTASPAIIAGGGSAVRVYSWEGGGLGLFYAAINWEGTDQHDGLRHTFGLTLNHSF